MTKKSPVTRLTVNIRGNNTGTEEHKTLAPSQMKIQRKAKNSDWMMIRFSG